MTNESERNINLFRVASLIGVGEKEIIKNVVLESLLLLHFLGEQKMKDQASAENINSVYPLLRQSRINGNTP